MHTTSIWRVNKTLASHPPSMNIPAPEHFTLSATHATILIHAMARPKGIPSYKMVRRLDGTVVKPDEALQATPVTPAHGKVLTSMEIRSRILAFMHDQDYDPIKHLVLMATEVDDDGKYVLDAKTRKEIHMELAQFIAPKLKSSDIQVDSNMSINITVKQFVKQGKDASNAKPVEAAKEPITLEATP